MQTFITSDTGNYVETAWALDRLRLNKQALEGWQILLTLLELDPNGEHRTPKGWVNHPAVKMWRDCEFALYEYIMAMVTEWKNRGYQTTIGDKATATMRVAWENNLLPNHFVDNRPKWMVDPERMKLIASSHRTALLAKNYEYYSQLGWAEDAGTQPKEYEYVWS